MDLRITVSIELHTFSCSNATKRIRCDQHDRATGSRYVAGGANLGVVKMHTSKSQGLAAWAPCQQILTHRSDLTTLIDVAQC